MGAGEAMGFDDAIGKLLGHAAVGAEPDRTMAFCALAERLLQGDGEASEREAAFVVLERLLPQAALPTRRALSKLVTSAISDSRMLRLLLANSIDDEWLATTALSEAEWRKLLPVLPSDARAVVEARSDLPPHIARMSAALGAADAQASEPPVDPAITEGSRHVRGLLARIAALRADGERHRKSVSATGDWRWECNQHGVVVHVEAGGPESLIGRPLLDLAINEAPLATAFQRHAPFRDFHIVATDTPSKAWSLAGVPFFDIGDGRFLGFRGTGEAICGIAGRPGETRSAGGLFGTGASSDMLSQMAHEVRSPLNAIMGFAQMIEGEMLGPADEVYRQRATAIIENATRLLAALDDLTDAAKLDQGFYTIHQQLCDLGALVEQAAARYRPLAQAGAVTVTTTIADGLPRIWSDERSAERALNRLLAAMIACADPGETLLLGAQPAANDHVRIFVSRPARLSGLSAEMLLDPTIRLEGEGAPVSGLGFGLRLVRQIGAALGGRFEIEPHLFVLTLPPFAQVGTRVAPRS